MYKKLNKLYLIDTYNITKIHQNLTLLTLKCIELT